MIRSRIKRCVVFSMLVTTAILIAVDPTLTLFTATQLLTDFITVADSIDVTDWFGDPMN